MSVKPSSVVNEVSESGRMTTQRDTMTPMRLGNISDKKQDEQGPEDAGKTLIFSDLHEE